MLGPREAAMAAPEPRALCTHACLAAAAALGLALGSASAAQTGGVTHVRIDGPLDRGSQALLVRAIDRAEAEGTT